MTDTPHQTPEPIGSSNDIPAIRGMLKMGVTAFDKRVVIALLAESAALILRAEQAEQERGLTFAEICRVSLSRANRWHPGGIEEWSPMEWAGAMAGEAGETCNAAKKLKRVETQIAHHDNRVFGTSAPTDEQAEAYRVQVAKEAADTILYAVLVMQRVGANPSAVLMDVFNKKSEEYNFPERLSAEAARGALQRQQRELMGRVEAIIKGKRWVSAFGRDVYAMPEVNCAIDEILADLASLLGEEP